MRPANLFWSRSIVILTFCLPSSSPFWHCSFPQLTLPCFRFRHTFSSCNIVKYKYQKCIICDVSTLFRMKRVGVGWGGQKSHLPVSTSPVTSINVGLSPQNFLPFVLTLLPHWCKVSRSHLVPIPNYSIWIKTTPQNSDFSGQILVK